MDENALDLQVKQYTNEREMESNHERELLSLEEFSKSLKKSKGLSKKEVEAKIIQTSFDLRAKHREETELLESYLESNGDRGEDMALKIESVTTEYGVNSTKDAVEVKKQKSLAKKVPCFVRLIRKCF